MLLNPTSRPLGAQPRHSFHPYALRPEPTADVSVKRFGGIFAHSLVSGGLWWPGWPGCACVSARLFLTTTRQRPVYEVTCGSARGASYDMTGVTGTQVRGAHFSHASLWFLVVRAARERCGACLRLHAAWHGCSRVGAASNDAGRGGCTLQWAVGWSYRQLRWLSGRLPQEGAW